MSTEPFIGEIKMLGFSFPPQGYQLCQGQMMSIANYTALFSLLGTTYGGDGVTTFGLPDLRSRIAIGMGQGTGLSNYEIGQSGGLESVTLIPSQLPMHNHGATGITVTLPVGTANADASAANNYIADATVAMGDFFGNTPSPTLSLGAATVSGSTTMAGSGQPISLLHPYLAINYSIAIEGIFPSRN